MESNPVQNSNVSIHKSVLLQEVVDGLDLKKGLRVLDGTINGGGHSFAICQKIGGSGILIGVDLDKGALARAEERLKEFKTTIHLEEDNFRNMDKLAEKYGIENFDAVLLDLGLSSDQLETKERGFSFQGDEPLLMTFKKELAENDLTAYEIVNSWDEENIADIIYGYACEKFSRRIARRISEARKETAIETTGDLVKIVEQAVPSWYRNGRINPATKTFQALRTAVNDEIESLREGLEKGIELLSSEGCIAVISFHSVEDRVVKRAFQKAAKEDKGIILTKKPIIPTLMEIKENPRARSAKLRIFKSI